MIHKQGINSEWRVSPIWPIQLPYLIIELDEEKGDHPYRYAVVGYPSRAYCWVLHRTPVMSADLFDGICRRLTQDHGYNLSNLVKVAHSGSIEAPLLRSPSDLSVNMAAFANKELELFDILKLIGKGVHHL